MDDQSQTQVADASINIKPKINTARVGPCAETSQCYASVVEPDALPCVLKVYEFLLLVVQNLVIKTATLIGTYVRGSDSLHTPRHDLWRCDGNDPPPPRHSAGGCPGGPMDSHCYILRPD